MALNQPATELRHIQTLIEHHDRVHISLSNVLLNQAAQTLKLKDQSNQLTFYILSTVVFVFFGCIWIVASGSLSSNPGGAFGLGESATFQTTVSDGLYASWLMLTTIGYGDLYPTTQGGKTMALFYMVATMAFISHGLSALYVYEKQIAERTARALKITLGMTRSSTSRMKQRNNKIRVIWWAKILGILSSYLPLFMAWFYIDFISLLFGSTEGWKSKPNEWGCGKCRLFAFMTMSTIGWGIGDMYDPMPPFNHTNLTALDDMVLCPQATTHGSCVWSPAAASCVCTLSDGARLLLLPFSIVGFVITGFALSTLFDYKFWQYRLCCCLNPACFHCVWYRLVKHPHETMVRRSSLFGDIGGRGKKEEEVEEAQETEETEQETEDEENEEENETNEAATDGTERLTHASTGNSAMHVAKRNQISCCSGFECRALLLPLAPLFFLLFVLPLVMMKWVATFEECVGNAANIGHLGYGFLSAAFVIIQTASTVGYGDGCMSVILSVIDPWLVILVSCCLLAVFGSYLTLMRYFIMALTNKAYHCCDRCSMCRDSCCCDVPAGEDEDEEGIELVASSNGATTATTATTATNNHKILAVPLWFLVGVILSVNFSFFLVLLYPPMTGYTCFPEIQGFTDFLYFLITTTTTVGFGDIVPKPTCVQGRVLTIAAMVAGSSSLVVLLTEILEEVDRVSSKVRQTIADEIEKSNGLHEVKTLLQMTQSHLGFNGSIGVGIGDVRVEHQCNENEVVDEEEHSSTSTLLGDSGGAIVEINEETKRGGHSFLKKEK
jgi:voltage-gated potassium channel Kch